MQHEIDECFQIDASKWKSLVQTGTQSSPSTATNVDDGKQETQAIDTLGLNEVLKESSPSTATLVWSLVLGSLERMAQNEIHQGLYLAETWCRQAPLIMRTFSHKRGCAVSAMIPCLMCEPTQGHSAKCS